MSWTLEEALRAIFEEEHGAEVDLICFDPFCGNVWTTLEFDGELEKDTCDCGMPGVRA